MAKEIERRFLVTEIDLNELYRNSEGIIDIRQGYLEPHRPNQHMRVRIMDSDKAVITAKSGAGMEREELEEVIPLAAAELVLKSCAHHLEKERRTYAGWEIDLFSPPLESIVLAEYEGDLCYGELEPPPFIKEAVEVTDFLTNLDLARLATRLRSINVKGPLAFERVLTEMTSIPKIVLTGGPCSGKSTLMKRGAKLFGEKIHCVPEAATILIAHAGVMPQPQYPLAMAGFQETIYALQNTFELSASDYAQYNGRSALLIDRGTIDNAAYMPNGLEDLEKLLGTSRSHEYSRYGLVLCLETPPRDVYEEQKANNPARHETYEEAVALGERIKKVWSGHPNFRVIPNGSGWEEKEAAVLSILSEFIEN